MSHEIRETDTVLLGEGLSAWHDLGIVKDGLLTIEEARRTVAPWEPIQDVPFRFVNGEYVRVEDWRMNVQPETGVVLGMVSDDYGLFENKSGFDLAQAILDQEAGVENVATAGTLKGQRLVWVLLKHGRELDINGDRFDPYLLVRWSHDGSMAVSADVTAVRVVCKNTWNAAERQAQRSWRARHTGNVEERAREARFTLRMADRYFDAFEEEVKQLQETLVTNATFERIVREEFEADVADLTKRAKNIRETKVEAVQSLWTNDVRVAPFKETGWGAVQAFSTWEEHERVVRGSRSERRALRSIEGSTLIDGVREKVLTLR